MDVYNLLQPNDLKQAAVIVASFVYNAAMPEQMLPRKPIEGHCRGNHDDKEQQ